MTKFKINDPVLWILKYKTVKGIICYEWAENLYGILTSHDETTYMATNRELRFDICEYMRLKRKNG